ncbi:MAG: FG-GAP repeat protein [Chloracidobacterium sp.]|nr:FG-GAP repeat protein [Chloracidobacterium sp.]
MPAAGDFDGDGKADIAVYRGGVWYIINSSNGSYRIELFGLPDDEPASAAYIQP